MTDLPRFLLTFALVLITMGLMPAALQAQAWPAKPMKFIVPSPAGTAPDIIARLTADKLYPALGQRVVVENRPGAGGIPGIGALIRSAADGYTFALVPASTVTLTPYLFKDPQFDVDRDLTPVAAMGTSPMMIAVGAKSGITSLAELIKAAKVQKGKVIFAYPLQNSVPHLTGYMLDQAAGIELYPVVYNGSIAAVTAVISGEAVVTIDGLPPLVGQVKAGELRPLAVTSRQRLPGYEDVPAAAEMLPNFESIGWFALFAPAGLPPAIVTRLNQEMNAVSRMPDIVARLAELGVYPNPSSPEALASFMRTQRTQWKKVIDKVGLQPQ
jgi:tripartite-type tricarboxylate transporter receptor subunit TctC